METHLPETLRASSEGRIAEGILRQCVHCGFCLSTCPTYLLLGNELDSPRGRIYQIKQVLETGIATAGVQRHLDRCLTCRACETTCPSGVSYGRLLEIGRAAVHAKVRRTARDRIIRWLAREALSRRSVFAAAVRLGRIVRWALPISLRRTLAGSADNGGGWPTREQSRKVLLHAGCVQPALAPGIDAATARVLDALGIESIVVREAGCCGAIRHHLDDIEGARAAARRNIDAWWPVVESGQIEAIIVSAAGCALMIREYEHLLCGDAAYGAKARRVAELARDPVQLLAPRVAALKELLSTASSGRIAFHPPCTLQHGLAIRRAVEPLLEQLGANVLPIRDAHLCCGAAGTYSLLQARISRELRDRKLQCLLENEPDEILSANIGCITHLQAATPAPVRHWIEWIDARISRHGSDPLRK